MYIKYKITTNNRISLNSNGNTWKATVEERYILLSNHRHKLENINLRLALDNLQSYIIVSYLKLFKLLFSMLLVQNYPLLTPQCSNSCHITTNHRSVHLDTDDKDLTFLNQSSVNSRKQNFHQNTSH